MGGLAEEVSFIGGHGVDHLSMQWGCLGGAQNLAEFNQRSEATLAENRRQAGLHQVLLFRIEHDPRPGIDVLLEIADVILCRRHRASTSRSMAGTTSSSGRI